MELCLKRPTLFLILAIALTIRCASVRVSPGGATTLGNSIRSAIEAGEAGRALWGVYVEDESGQPLYAHESRTLMLPASNRKLFTAALVDECLGPTATLPTTLYADGRMDGSVLYGNLVLKGGGDPSLGGRYDADRDTRLQPFVDALRERGITRITGSIVADVSQFSRELLPASWKIGYVGETYGAPVDALAFNENVIGFLTYVAECTDDHVTTDPSFVPAASQLVCSATTDIQGRSDSWNHVVVSGTVAGDSVPVRKTVVISAADPGLYAAQALQDVLAREGIEVDNPPRLQITPRGWTDELARIESPSVYQLLGTVLKNSQNLYAEMLYRDSVPAAPPVSYAAAEWYERIFLTAVVGLDPQQFSFADGCGLSVEDLVTPEAVVKIVRYLDTGARGRLFQSLLATPGEEGTLHRRYKDLRGRLYGKTGTLNGVEALSGYVIGRSGGKRYFSIIVNHYVGPGDSTHVIDRIMTSIADF